MRYTPRSGPASAAPFFLALSALVVTATACSNRSLPEGKGAAPPGAEVALDVALPPARAYTDVLIDGVPHVRQKPDFCGEACVEMATRKLGKPLSQDEVFNRSGLHPGLGRGVYAAELQEVLERIGFEPGPVWFKIDAAAAAEGLAAQFDALYNDLRQGTPSIVCMHYDESPATTEHFRLVLGYDAAKDELIYHEPAQDGGAYRRMKRAAFLRMWPLKYASSTWTVIRMRLTPGEGFGKATGEPARAGFSPADYAQRVMAMRKKAGPNFTVVVEPPFVVAGDGSPRALESGARTVEWTVRLLKQDYFSKDPAEILEVWLFNGAQSYRKNTRAFFGDKPTTPYGYYSPKHKALIMDITTGGGTLVHEIVHPFIESNFPECPPWFNEGLGSLYEQSGERGGHIRGLTNWRLAGLKEAIRAGRVPSFRDLTAADSDAFYNEDRGTNYAQARYLLYYLQERGLLVRYYKDFYEKRLEDPTGYETLKRVLGEQDMDAFKARWETYVMGLVFPEE
jgi:hypothetical protein